MSNKCDTVLVFIYLLTTSACFVPTTKILTAEGAAALFFQNVFQRFGLPREIVSDWDVRFTSQFWAELFRHLCTELNLSTA
uniref:Ribonuclease h-like n=1 Tax=Tetraselmis sp. GSL018 TaxID=582737 RepID=A0A061S6K8_9CHLO